jgi:protein-disulfide isomerase
MVAQRQQPPRAQAARAQSNARFYSALAIVAVVGVAAIGYVATHKQSAAASVPTTPPDPSTLGAAKGHVLGNATAPITIMEFADFECPACGTFAVVTEPDVRARLINTGRVNYQFFDFPLPMHKNTWYASEAAACAEDQGKFWEMHDRLFQGQNDWNGEATDNPASVFKGYAKELNLDVDKFQHCYDTQAHLRDIQANQAEGNRRHVNQTPTFVIGARQIPGALGFDQLKAYVDSASPTPAPAPAPAAAPARAK